MPTIPYPNVPQLPGVPALARGNNAKFAGAALNIVGQLLPLDLFGTTWGIVKSNSAPTTSATKANFFQNLFAGASSKLATKGTVLLRPDSFIDFEYRKDQKIPTYPMQDGAFQSYNKVALPFDIRLTVTCSGNGKMKKGPFLEAVNNLLNGLDLVDIVTPDATYKSCNLIHVDYRRDATNGATIIIAQLWFQWVRIVSKSTTNTAAPSGTPSTPLGQVSPVSSIGGAIKVPTNGVAIA